MKKSQFPSGFLKANEGSVKKKKSLYKGVVSFILRFLQPPQEAELVNNSTRE